MKICHISDTHGCHRQVTIPYCDLLIHSGDIMTDGYTEYELTDFLDWFNSQRVLYKVFIAGNHDWYFDTRPWLCKEILGYFPNITYLENSGITIEGINIWGTPDTKIFFNWAFNKTEEQLRRIYGFIPEDTNILISHGPAYGICDQLERGDRVGEKPLADRVKELPNLKYHLSGHIHGAYGIEKLEKYTAINASVVNEKYIVTNDPIVFELNL